MVITEQLRDGMRNALQSGKFPWQKRMVVLPGTESRSRSNVFSPDGRTDIPIFMIEIFFRFFEHDPHVIIECKRVDGNNAHLCREYVVEGIDRFRLGKYGSNHSTGFMVGYLIAEDAKTATAGINRYLNRKSRDIENLNPSTLVNESWVWESIHAREEISSIELHHLYLSFVNP